MSRRQFGSIQTRADRPGTYVRFRWKGRRYKRYGGMTKAIAQKKLAQLQTKLDAGVEVARAIAEVFGGVVGATMTFRQAIDLYLVYCATRRTPSTLKSYQQALRLIARARWAAALLGEIASRDIQGWTGERIAGGASGATVNRNLNLISGLFRWAIRCGYVADNPVRRVERFSERGRARETYLTAMESRALVASARPGICDVVLTALHTGMRRGELLALRWGHVDLARRQLVVSAATEKAGRGRVVPMTAVLYGRLAELRTEHPRAIGGADPVFVFPDGSEVTSKALRSGFERAARVCDGIPLEKREKITFHCLRHTAASLMVAEGVPLFDVAKILGHLTLAVTMRYAHFAPEAGRAGIDKLGRALQDGSSRGGVGGGSVAEGEASYTPRQSA